MRELMAVSETLQGINGLAYNPVLIRSDTRNSLLVVVVVNVAGTEAEERSTGSNVLPVVVGIGDAEVSTVSASGAVAVTVTS